jgi:16S rRNA (cytosine967-C5)-methyltransferase
MTMTAREIAAEALRDFKGNVTGRLDRLLQENELSPADIGLAREITYGVERRRGSLNAIMRAHLTKKRTRLADPIRRALQVGLYQLLFCDRIPDHAAVDQAVEMIQHSRHRGAAGFVNGLLRTIAREHETVEQLAPDNHCIPLTLTTGLRFPRPVVQDIKEHPVEHLAAAWSLPPELVARWIDAYTLDVAWGLGAHSCAHPALICRVNRLRSTPTEVMNELDVPLHRNGMSVVLPSGKGLTELPAFIEGKIQPQDATATAVVEQCDLRPGMRVFDFCAAPGTKTVHMAEKMRNTGEIVAVDVNEDKIARIKSGCERMGVDIVTPVLAQDLAQVPLKSFDLVLVDAPCSNTGVLSRRPEARWRFNEDAIARYRRDQMSLLRAASEYVGAGGTLVYSTCSIEADENERVAKAIGKRVKNLHLKSCRQTLPSGSDDPTQWNDGGFMAVFRG